MIIWQLGSVGNFTYSNNGRYDVKGFKRVIDRLLEQYPADHEVIVYEASIYPTCDAVIKRVPLSLLSEDMVTGRSTLYVPPKGRKQCDEVIMRELDVPDIVKKRVDASPYD